MVSHMLREDKIKCGAPATEHTAFKFYSVLHKRKIASPLSYGGML